MIEYRKTAVTYQGDGNTSVFPFSFAVTDANSVRVSIYDKATDVSVELTRDYFVDMTANVVHYPGYAPGESVDAHAQPPKLPRGKNITIYRVTPIDQLTDLGNKYPLPYIETMADKLTAILQEHDEMLGRAVTSQKGSGITPKELIDSIFRTGEKVDAAMNAANGSAAHAAASQTAAKSSEDAAREMTEQMHTVFSNSVTEIKRALLCSMNGDTEDETKLATVGWVKSKFQDLLKNALQLSGVRWNLESIVSGGYIYFGKLFGGLIIEFVYFNTNNSDNNNEQEKPLPLALNRLFYGNLTVFSVIHTAVPVVYAGLTPDKGRIRVKFSVGREKSAPVYGIIIGTI